MRYNTEKMLKDITQIESKLKKFDVSGKIVSLNPKVVIEFSYTLDFNEHFQCYWEKINLDSYNDNDNAKNEILETLKDKILENIKNLELLYRTELEDKLGALDEDVEALIGELDKIV